VADEGPVARAAAVAALGLGRPLSSRRTRLVVDASRDDDPRVRAAALGAAVRAADPDTAAALWQAGTCDPDPSVRRRSAELAPHVARRGDDPSAAAAAVTALLGDEPSVAETAAWALGELGPAAVESGSVARLSELARAHADPLVREAAVAALGAIGHPDGLDAILAACHDRPAIRRRAVLALAPFDGPNVRAALAAALDDRDWQVRQAAEDLRDA
jgi:HEAT repeat protein